MSIQAVAWALGQDLPARPKLVLVAIANHARHTDGYCWLKAETIASEAACKPRSVYRFVADLIRNGYIKKELRRGDDGKQRANDYWILFNRQDAAWVSVGNDAAADDAELHGSEGDEPQDVEGAEAPITEPSDGHDSRSADVEKPPESPGPRDSVVTHTNTAEPSKIKPENACARALPPRGYQPPPPPPAQPMGSTTIDGSGPLIFVFIGTPAYEAWQARKSRELGRSWKQQTTKNGRYGWYFPSLFPPSEKPPPASADKPLATDEELNDFVKMG